MNVIVQKTPRTVILLGGEGLRPNVTSLWDQIREMATSTDSAISLVYAGVSPQNRNQHERRIKSTIQALTRLNVAVKVLDTNTANPAEITGIVYLSGTDPVAIVESLSVTPLWDTICSPERLVIVSSGASVAIGERTFAPVAPYPPALNDLAFQVTAGLGMIPGIMVLPYFGWLQDIIIEKLADLASDLWLVGIDDQAALIIHRHNWEVAGLGTVTIFKAGERPQRFDSGMTIPLSILDSTSGEDNR